MAHNIEAEFLMDYTDEAPKRLVRLTMDRDAVSALRHALYDGANHREYLSAPRQTREEAYGLASFMGNLESELSQRSLFSLEDFKAGKPAPEASL